MRPHGFLLALWYANTCVGRALNQSSVGTDFYKCESSLYGRPNFQHCKTTLKGLPGIGPGVPTPKFMQTRKFVEPQFLDPPYSRVEQDFEGEIEQLPKIWTHSESCPLDPTNISEPRELTRG